MGERGELAGQRTLNVLSVYRWNAAELELLGTVKSCETFSGPFYSSKKSPNTRTVLVSVISHTYLGNIQRACTPSRAGIDLLLL